jgi:hypothetical protein
MVHISRRAFSIGMCSLPILRVLPAYGETEADGRIAIIDTIDNAALQIDRLQKLNIKIVGRYYSREENVASTKRMRFNCSDGGDKCSLTELEPSLLIKNNISILSVYQYNNSSRSKFLYGLRDTKRTMTPKGEAEADADAALKQAAEVSQPNGSEIYFGVDMELRREDHSLQDAIKRYFETIRKSIGTRYKIGVYGSGLASSILLKDRLVD